MEDTKLPKKELIHDLNPSKKKGSSSPKQLIFTIVIVLILGIGTGYIASNVSGSGKGPGKVTSGPTAGDEIKKGFTVGVSNTSEFPDVAEGVLKAGGFEGEGEYHLIRPGGDSQTAYLFSSVVDFSKFVDKKIKVWGKSQTPQKVGWLLDVGKIEVQ